MFVYLYEHRESHANFSTMLTLAWVDLGMLTLVGWVGIWGRGRVITLLDLSIIGLVKSSMYWFCNF